MDSKQSEDERVDISFESHPPIDDDLNGINTLLKQTLLQFIDCHALAQYLIEQKDVTQVIAQESIEDSTSEDDDPDDDIYGVSSIVDLDISDKASPFVECRKQLVNFIKDKCPEFKKRSEDQSCKLKAGLIINERYINLPPQLSLPVFKTLTKSIEEQGFTHLIFISKILLRSKNTDTTLPSKRSKSRHTGAQDSEPLVFVNPEEEIICEQSDYQADLDVSAHCDENATWSFSSDVKYIPHRRVIIVDYKNWPKIMESLEKELN